MPGNDVVKGRVRGIGVRAHQSVAGVGLIDQVFKTCDAVGILQAVEIVKHQAQFGITELARGLADFLLLHVIIEIGDGILIKTAEFQEIQRLPVVEQVHVLQRQQEIGKGLRGNIDGVFVRHEVDPVSPEVQHHFVTVALVGASADAAEEPRFFFRMGAVGIQHVQQHSVCLRKDKSIVINKGNRVSGTVNRHGVGVAVRPRERAGLSILGKAQTEGDVLVLIDIFLHQIGHQLAPVFERQIRYIRIADKVDRLRAGIIHAVQIEGHVL